MKISIDSGLKILWENGTINLNGKTLFVKNDILHIKSNDSISEIGYFGCKPTLRELLIYAVRTEEELPDGETH